MMKLQPEEILNSLPEKYYVIDIKTKKILQSNDKLAQKTTASCHKFLFNNKFPCHSSDEQCICQQLIKEKNRTEFIVEKETDLLKQTFRAKATRLKENLIIASYVNISKELITAKELKINTRRLERAEKLTKFGYWEFHIEERIMLSSKGARDIYGLNKYKIPLHEVQQIPLPEYRMELDRSLLDLIKHNKAYNIKFKIKRPNDGQIRHIHSIAEYRPSKKMVFGVIHDITEAAQTQLALEESEHNFNLLFEHMNNAFAFHKLVTDLNGNPIDYIFVNVNSKFEKMVGLNREQLINKRVLEVLPNTEKFWIERYGKVAITGEPISFSEYSAQLNKHFEISAYSPKEGYFAVTFNDITDRVNSKNALEKTLIDLKLAQQIAKVGNWKYDPYTKSMQWSDQVFKIFEQDLNAGPLDVQTMKKYLGNEIAIFEKAVSQGKAFEIEKKLETIKTGKWVKIIGMPTRVEGNEKFQIRGTIQDISEIKRIQNELREQNQLLQTVIDNIPDAIYMKDITTRKIMVNIGDAKNCGFNHPEEIMGKTDFDLFPKSVAQKYFNDDEQVIKSGIPVINREEILPGKKSNRVILTSKFPLRNNNDEIIGLVGIGRDITEIKEKESELQLLKLTVENSPLPIIITDKNGTFQYVNPAFTKTTGYSSSFVIGKKTNLLKSGEMPQEFYNEMWSTINAGKNWSGEFYNRRKNGERYWERGLITPILDKNKKIIHFVAIKEDVTEKKQMVKDLEIAKEKAEQSDRLKSLFLANMSHEIRTPLNGILGFSNFICQGENGPEQLDMYGGIIKSCGQRLMTVIDDIIDISLIQSNQLKVDIRDFDINELLNELYVLYSEQNKNKLSKINFEVEYFNEKHPCLIYSDKGRVFQVLRNLLDNAFKFTENGSISFGVAKLENNEAFLYVKDTGIGIKQDKIKVIFESFRQAEEGGTRKYEGTGLGLSIVTGILEKLDGRIWVESEFGQGTTFYVALPLSKATPVKTTHEIKNKKSKTSSPKSYSIVSFEDDLVSAEFLKNVASMLGHQITNYVDVYRGIEALKTNKPDLVLMDIQLPQINGYEATRMIKKMYPNLPVIIQTAYAMSGDREKAFEAHADDYITKPISSASLQEKINNFLS